MKVNLFIYKKNQPAAIRQRNLNQKYIFEKEKLKLKLETYYISLKYKLTKAY